MFQADDIDVVVDITDEKTGVKLNASDFVAGKYEISSLSGAVLFSALFPGDISIVDEEFVLTYPRAINSQTGDQKHEMRVRDAQGKESTIVQQFINNQQTSVRL